jgi:primosomal protein N' (replication factor Y) (superfamily II helicase)
VLVPEIALTPQTVQRFYRIFGDQIAVLHSRLTERERFEAWQSLKSGEKRIAIGPRSAVFAPVRDVGLIVVDEEHDTSYKQYDPAPRYHARDVAVMRAHMENAVAVLGSATPGMVSVQAVKEGKARAAAPPDASLPAPCPKCASSTCWSINQQCAVRSRLNFIMRWREPS